MNEAEKILWLTTVRPVSVDHSLIRQSSSAAGIAISSALRFIRRIIGLASAFNSAVLALTLGSYGSLLSTHVFWLCWSILVTEAVVFNCIRPYWNCIENLPDGSQGIIQSYSNCIENLPDESQVTKTFRPSDHGRAGVVFLKVGMSIALVSLFLYNQDITHRQTKILLFVALSIIVIEGFARILIVSEQLLSLILKEKAGSLRVVWMPSNNIVHGRNAANFLNPSVINAMIGATGAIVLVGNLGSLMPEKLYWIFVSICVVELLAEVIHRFGCGKRSVSDMLEDLPNTHYVAMLLRLVIEGFLCGWMIKEISQDSLPYVSACNWQCEERIKQLLVTMAALGVLQAAGIFIARLCACVLPRCLPPTLFSTIVSTIVLIGYLLHYVTYKLLRCFCDLTYKLLRC